MTNQYTDMVIKLNMIAIEYMKWCLANHEIFFWNASSSWMLTESETLPSVTSKVQFVKYEYILDHGFTQSPKMI